MKKTEDVRERTINSNGRQMSASMNILIKAIAILLSTFCIYTSIKGTLITPIIHRSFFLGISMCLFFLVNPVFKKNPNSKLGWSVDVMMALLALSSMAYIFLFNDSIMLHWGEYRFIDVFFGGVIIIVVLESVRRAHFVFFILAVLSLIYMFFGPFLPWIFYHPGVTFERILTTQSLTVEGIYGSPVAVASSYLFLFILLGVFLEKTKASDLFIQSGLSLFGRFTGGPAKVAVVSSSLMGSIVGSPMANVVTTGVFTIPLMKKSGFTPHAAGAVEAVASTGGQVIPPIMGAGAFLMAEITGIPYSTIAIAAVIPALLYVIGVFMSIHFYASRNNLTGLSDLPSIHSVLKKFGHQTISLLVLLYLIMIKGYSPTYAGIISLGVVLVVSSLRATTRLNFPDIIQCLEKGAINILTLAILMGGVGIVVGSVVISGLGMRFSDLLLSISGGNLPITLILVMIICIVLGMGMPISVAYLVSAMFAAPALIALGVPKLVAHFFVFFFSVSSGLTPPVCLTSIVAAGVAEANWVKTACKAFVFALPIFIVPFMFVFGPQLLMQGSWNAILLAAVTSIIGVVALAGATQGQWFFGTNRWWECIILAFCSVTLLETSLYSDIIGIGGIAIICIAQWLRSKSIIPADNMGN